MERKVIGPLARCAPLGLALLLGAAGASAQQMYKWTDAKGVVHFSDQPPPASVRKVELKSFDAAAKVELPYALAEAARNSPVVLYTTPSCESCDQGRALLLLRGIPFAEKTVQSNEDQQKLKDAGSDGQLPLLRVGAGKRIGFEAGAWNEALTEAAYPLQRMLPAAWQNPAAVSAAAPRPPARNAVREQPAVPANQPKAPSDAPPGFQF